MFGPFGSRPFVDAQLGELRRSRGAWRGSIRLDGARAVPLVVSGPRSAPDAAGLAAARAVPLALPSWRPAIERALFEHCAPSAEALGANPAVPPLRAPSDVWPYTTVAFVHVAPLDGRLTVEIGLRVAWDEEHTLGARLHEGRLVELNGSVLAP